MSGNVAVKSVQGNGLPSHAWRIISGKASSLPVRAEKPPRISALVVRDRKDVPELRDIQRQGYVDMVPHGMAQPPKLSEKDREIMRRIEGRGGC